MKKYTNFDLNVFGLKIPVLFTSDTLVVDGKACYGHYNNEDGKELITVYTGEGTSRNQIMITVFHELLHSVFYRLGMENSLVSYEMHELIADNFAKALVENFDFDI